MQRKFTRLLIGTAVAAVALSMGSVADAARTQGIDVSQWQGNMNWNTAYSQDVRFTFVRASRGGTKNGPYGIGHVEDGKFVRNVNELRALAVNSNKTIYNGFYHYGRPDLIAVNDGNNVGTGNTMNSQPSQSTILASAHDEAQNFYSFVGSHLTLNGVDAGRRLRPVLDLEERGGPTGEDPNADIISPANLSIWALAFMDKFQQLSGGVRPLVYMNTNYSQVAVTSAVAGEDLWIANWNQTTYGNPVTGTGSPPTGVFGAGNWDFWQYSADGNGKGLTYGAQSTDIDLDVANGDLNFVRGFLIPEPGTATLALAAAFTLLRRRRMHGVAA